MEFPDFAYTRFGALENYKDKVGLEDDDIERIREQIQGYKSNNLLYRIKNAVLAIFCQSDWQKAARFVTDKIIEKVAKVDYERASIYEKAQMYFNAYKTADDILKREITPDCLMDAPFFSPFSYTEWISLQS